MRTIYGVSISYIILMAAVMAHISPVGEKLRGAAFGEALFATPMMISCLLSVVMKHGVSRRVMLVFETAFSMLTVLVFVSTFAGEHDAQYQLALLILPLIGFPAVAIAGMIAAYAGRWTRPERV